MDKETSGIDVPKGKYLLTKKELISLLVSTAGIGYFFNDALGLFHHVVNFITNIM